MENEMHLVDANKLTVCYINVGTVMFPKMEAFVRAEDIKSAPIVDAAPVIHGRWIRDAVNFGSGTWGLIANCSECGERYAVGKPAGIIRKFTDISEKLSDEFVKEQIFLTTENIKLYAKRCHNCGAIMDQKES